jgi:hypothetical protein
MTRSVVVTRKELGLPDLQLEQKNKYYIPDGTFSAGETGHRRVTSDSPMVKGRYPSSVVESERVANIGVHVISTEANLQADSQVVIDAMSQFRYLLSWQWDGLSGVWQCEAADWAVGQAGVLDQRFLELHTQIIYFTVTHNRISGF